MCRSRAGPPAILISPDFRAFAAIGADVDIFPALQHLPAEFHIAVVMPDLSERFALEIAQGMLRIFVKTTRHYQPVPGDDGRMPQTPAMVVEAVLENIGSVPVLVITAVFFIPRYQTVGVVPVVIDLGGFESYLVHPGLLCQTPYVLQLVFVWPDDEELKKHEWLFALQFFFPPDDIARAFQYFIESAAHPVLLIDILCGTVDGNDEPVQSALDCPFGVPVVEIMRIRGGCGIDPLGRSIGYHVEEGRVQIRFALKIKDQVEEFAGQLIDRLPEKAVLQHSCRAGEGAKAAGTLGATQIAGGGRLEGQRYGIAPLNGFFGPLAEIIAAKNLHPVDDAAQGEFGKKIDGIVAVKIGHGSIKILIMFVGTYGKKIEDKRRMEDRVVLIGR